MDEAVYYNSGYVYNIIIGRHITTVLSLYINMENKVYGELSVLK